MVSAAEEYGVPLGVLYAIGLTETGRRGSLQPYALNVDGKPYYPETATAGAARFMTETHRGARHIDVGCMQINHRYHGKEFQSLRQMFEPFHNVRYAAKFLKALRAREGNWTRAVARYHAGPTNRAAHKRYVCKVIANMVVTGFGQWTQSSRQLCSNAVRRP